MHHKFSLDAQRRTTRARAEEIARGWGTVLLDPTPRDAIIADTCARWSAQIVLHWECQTLTCGTCTEYPVPKEETTGKMVADALYFNRVQRAPYWYMLSGENTIVEVRYVVQTGVQMQEISGVNKLP